MKCDFVYIGPAGEKHQHRCKRCGHVSTVAEPDPARVSRPCVKTEQPGLKPEEAKELFGSDDPKLIGNKIAALTTALGIPPCGGCEKRKAWLNAADLWVREKFGAQPSDPAPGPGQHDGQGNGDAVV